VFLRVRSKKAQKVDAENTRGEIWGLVGGDFCEKTGLGERGNNFPITWYLQN